MKVRAWSLPTLLLTSALLLTGAGRRDRDTSLLSYSSNSIMIERIKGQPPGKVDEQKLLQKLRVLEDANDKIVLNLLRKKPAASESVFLARTWLSFSLLEKDMKVFGYISDLDERRGLRLQRSSQYYRKRMEQALIADPTWGDNRAENLFLYIVYREEPSSRAPIRSLVVGG